MMKILYDESRFIEQENTIGLTSDLNKFGKINIHYSLTNWSNNFKIYDQENTSEIINELILDQSNISINWLKKLNKYSFEFNLISLLKMISNQIICH